MIMIFTRVPKESEIYKDREVEYEYKIVRIYELKADEVLKSGIKCMYPFVLLMKDGERFTEKAEMEIYKTKELNREEKADLLTGMMILAGLVSKDLARELQERRRDIIIELAAYELIKEEGC
ncbi:hypothetical protein M1N06_00320 [Peptococcaceae bacterium]|nr:hypothetical protein [Peptococcaceae bacterium]